jgi:hypothetical protein
MQIGAEMDRDWTMTRIMVSATGLLYGLWQMISGLRGMFVFTNKDAQSVGTWIVLIAGLLVTFPAILVSLVRPNVGAWILTISAFLTAVASLWIVPSWKYLPAAAVLLVIPNATFGCLLFRISRKQVSDQ